MESYRIQCNVEGMVRFGVGSDGFHLRSSNFSKSINQFLIYDSIFDSITTAVLFQRNLFRPLEDYSTVSIIVVSGTTVSGSGSVG